jgi:DNA-directed RNA polymerase subunit RPC12/RpoP
VKMFQRKSEASRPTASASMAVTCKNCQTEILINVEPRRLPQDFSVQCPKCRARKMFIGTDVHAAKLLP